MDSDPFASWEPFTRPPQTKVITFRVTVEEWKILCELSHERSMTLSDLLREGLRGLIKKGTV